MKSFKYLMSGVYGVICAAFGFDVTTLVGAVVVASGCLVIWLFCTRMERGL